ncbi:terminase family protein [uncultured Chryseobacterium sp.]|uniref:terminase large subunit domain-containing protein n=1 Tax=uncultured Chryseobacterium sp. TaxID=259322 RepID=UPI00258F351A|nr:terminase family protein [uncultured Chryseobacterium sp.]
MAESNHNIIRPQEGYQLDFASTSADICIGGGAAGVGKTFSLLLEPIRHKDVPGFGSVIFRRTNPQIRNEGGLWDTSESLYNLLGANPKQSTLEWDFGQSKLKFSHLEHEKNIYDWQGSQIPFIGFDELTHFTKKMFFYLLTRNRSVCGVNPYVRATCNPDPDSWVAEFISWWIDQETGFAIPERRGVLRYLIVDGDNYIWGDSKEEVIEKGWHILEEVVKRSGIDPNEFVKSVTFIGGSIYDNKELLKENPAYLGNLLAQDKDVQAALLHSNWKAVLSDNDIYNYHSFLGMFNNVYDIPHDERYITADIALEGSDKFLIGCWYGRELMDASVIDKSNGKEVIDAIITMAKNHRVQNKHICYDNDGVGGFVEGFISGAIPFHNGGTPLPNPELTREDPEFNKPEKYEHLKAQCYYRSGKNVDKGLYKINERVANMMYDDKMTIRQRFLHERKAIKKDKLDQDKKLCIIKKGEMKTKLNGQSPDLMDMFMMRERFDLEPLMPKQFVF